MNPVVIAGLLLLSAGLRASGDESRLGTLAKLVADPHPRVRLEAVRALAKIGDARAAELVLGVLELPMDPTLDYAAWLAINELSEPWIAALESGAWKPEGREKQLAFALQAIRPGQAARVLGRVLSGRPLARDGAGPWIELVGKSGDASQLGALYRQAIGGGFDDAAAARALRSLADASRARKLLPEGDAKAVARLLDSPSENVRIEALRVVAAWKSHAPGEIGLARIAGADPSDAVRSAAFELLRQGGGEAVDVLRVLAADPDPVTARRAVVAWAGIDFAGATPALVRAVTELRDESQSQDFWRTILATKDAGRRVAGILPAAGIPLPAARAGMRVAREGGRNDMDLVMALAKGSGLAAEGAGIAAGLIRDLASRAATTGDPRRGEMVYRRAELACVTCHAIGGAGGKVGPDLTSIGASAPGDYLVESVLMPDAKIKEGYYGVVIETKDGRALSGTVARESGSGIVLRSPAGQEIAVAAAEIENRSTATASLMPGGLLDNLPEAERLDLFAFLSRLGKPGEFDASRGGVARRWRVASLVHTDVQNGQADWMWRAARDDKRWTDVLSRVNGDLTRTLIEGATRGDFWTAKLAVLAMTEIHVATAGTVRLRLAANPAAELWVDGAKAAAPLELAAGTHRVVVRIDPRSVPDAFRLESSDASFSLD